MNKKLLFGIFALIFVVCAMNVSALLTTDLVGHWTLDYDPAYDNVSNYMMTNNGDTHQSGCKFGGCFNQTSATGVLNASAWGNPSGWTGMTIQYWLYATGSSFTRDISQGDIAGGSPSGFSADTEAKTGGTAFDITFANAGSLFCQSTVVMGLYGQWNLIQITFNGSESIAGNRIKLWVNNVSVTCTGSGISVTSIGSTSEPLRIMGLKFGGTIYYAPTGTLIDEPSIWNRAISSTEQQEIYYQTTLNRTYPWIQVTTSYTPLTVVSNSDQSNSLKFVDNNNLFVNVTSNVSNFTSMSLKVYVTQADGVCDDGQAFNVYTTTNTSQSWNITGLGVGNRCYKVYVQNGSNYVYSANYTNLRIYDLYNYSILSSNIINSTPKLSNWSGAFGGYPMPNGIGYNTSVVSINHYDFQFMNSTNLVTLNSTNGTATTWDPYIYNMIVGDPYALVLTVVDAFGNSISDTQSLNVTRNALLNITAYDYLTNGSISNLTVTLYDLTDSTSELLNVAGALLNVNIIKGHSYSALFDVPTYAYQTINFTANNSIYQSLNQSLFKTNSVNINVYDESSLVLITSAIGGGIMNITFISDLGSTTYNTTSGSLFVSNITAGTYEVKFNAPLYAQRSYYLTITNRSTQNLNAYLSQSTINLLLTYVNKETGELIENVGVNVYKIINGSWTAVATGFTDITGRWQVSVATNTNYRFSSTITGYNDKTFNLNPIIFTAYTIQLTKQQASSSQLDFANINVYILNTTFTNNGSNYFSWQISAPNGNLESYSYSLYTQCKNITSFSGVNAYGGINTNSFNLSCASINDHVTLNYNYTLTGGEIRSFTYTYSIIGNAVSGSFMSNNTEHYGMGLFERILLVVLITIVMAGLITKFSNIVAGLGAGLLILSYMSYIGFIEWWLIAPTLLVGFVLISAWSTTR
jgi:5-hydroxyisourate hydrolase-like protein (transthyretin family)